MGCSSSGLYPSTCPAWVTLPGDCAPACIALWVTETHKPSNHDKVAAQQRVVVATVVTSGRGGHGGCGDHGGCGGHSGRGVQWLWW